MPFIEYEAYNGDVILVDPDYKLPEISDVKVPIINRANLGSIPDKIHSQERYDKFVNSEHFWGVLRGTEKQVDVCEKLGMAQNELSVFARQWVKKNRDIHFNRKSHQQFSADKRLLEPTGETFAKWRAKYFRDVWNNEYMTPPHQMIWVDSILETIEHGAFLTIMAPPRHGKSDLLAHFCIWQILRNSNIRILWIGGNGDIAEKSANQVKEELSRNEGLRRDFLKPGEDWRPGKKDQLPWKAGEFTVANRTITGIRSATMTALGRGSKVLSLDADFIIIDDIEDADSVSTEGTLEKTKNYLHQNIFSRKEEHTGIVNIGSRQHINDFHGSTLINPLWETIVNKAHKPDCDLPEHEGELPRGHITAKDCPICSQHTDCCLFPSLRTYKFLMEQRQAMGPAKFSKIYQNEPSEGASLIFAKKSVMKCRNPYRPLGVAGLKWLQHHVESFNIIGGLDPAGSGFQAAVLKAYSPTTQQRYIVDIDNNEGGGFKEALRIIKEWWEKYQLGYWVIEDNLYHGGMLEDPSIMAYCAKYGIQLEGHQTGRNKWDENFGVSAMGPLFDNGLYDIPWEDQHETVQDYINQLITFQKVESRKARNKTDIVMADWFTEVGIRAMGWQAEAYTVSTQSVYGYDDSLADGYVPLGGVELQPVITR